MSVVNDYSLRFGSESYVPIVIGGMGVDISTSSLALEACRLGGVGHISDAMIPFLSDRLYRTDFSYEKGEAHKESVMTLDKSKVKFDLDVIRQSQLNHVRATMSRKRGPGLIFVNVMEKLTMADPAPTLGARLNAAMDGGIDGITLSAGLHMQSVKLMESNSRFRDVKIGVIVSSARALKIFLRSAARSSRMPDYIVVEGPLAGGHLGFAIDDWQNYDLAEIVKDVLQFLKDNDLSIPVIPAGGIFTGSDAAGFLEMGASAVQVATRFTITQECGYPDKAKLALLKSSEDDVVVTSVSPTGYPLRMLKSSPCLRNKGRPNCEALGYILDGEGKCQYIDYVRELAEHGEGRQKICLCLHFGGYTCYTCGHYAYRLKDTTNLKDDGTYQLPSAEHVFRDYQFSKDGMIQKPSLDQEERPSQVIA